MASITNYSLLSNRWTCVALGWLRAVNTNCLVDTDMSSHWLLKEELTKWIFLEYSPDH